MAGAGRRSGYRKGVTSDVLESFPEPGPSDKILRVTGLRGSNIMEVLTAGGETSLAMLPTKFRKLIWVKRGDFVMATGVDKGAECETHSGKGTKVNFMVTHVLYKEQIKHLQQKALWPDAFAAAVARDVSVATMAAAGGWAAVSASQVDAAAAATAMAAGAVTAAEAAPAEAAPAKAAPAEAAAAGVATDGALAGAMAGASIFEGAGAACGGNVVGGVDMSQYEYEQESDDDSELWTNNNKMFQRKGKFAESSSESSDDDE